MKIKEILGTGYMDKSFKNEKDFFAKYFTRPFLTRKARKDRPIRVKVNKKGLPENFADGKKKGKSTPRGLFEGGLSKEEGGDSEEFQEYSARERSP